MLDSGNKASSRGIVLDTNSGLVITGDVHGNVIHYTGGEATLTGLTIPWRSEPHNTIDSMLHWRSRLPETLYGRDEELQTLTAWAETGPKISIFLLHGEGGVGKTRLAFEFAEQLIEKGWRAGQLGKQQTQFASDFSDNGLLLIIDYPEERQDTVQTLLENIAYMPEPDKRLRILLLGRNPSSLNAMSQQAIDSVAGEHLLKPMLDDETGYQQQIALLRDGWEKIQTVQQSGHTLPLDDEAIMSWLQRSEHHRKPLFILAYALNLSYDPAAITLSGTQIIAALVERESQRLSNELEKQGSSKEDIEGVLLLRALAAISHGLDDALLQALIESEVGTKQKLPSLAKIRSSSLYLNHQIPSLEPDILAAQLLHQEFEKHSHQAHGWLYQLHTLNTDAVEIDNRLKRLARLRHDASYTLKLFVTDPVVQSLSSAIEQQGYDGIMFIAPLNRYYLEKNLFVLTVAVGRQQVEDLTEKAEENFASYGPDLASSLNNLSVDLAETGDRAGGLAAIRRSVEIYDALAEENFSAYGPDLAMSLNNLSNRLAESGDRAGGLEAIRRSVEIREALAEENFSAYGPDLAMSLNNLSVCLAESGDRSGGLEAIQRAVEIREQLARENFSAYGPDLAMSLNNLSNRLAESGDRAGGLEAIQRAVEIREQLARENFSAYGPDLAMSLNNLSNRLAESGDRAGGLEAIQRAVEIREQLARENFSAYGPDLAMSLNNLSNRLAESGDRSGGLEAIQRAVEIYEQLARENFAAYGPNLATSLNNLSVRLSESGDRAGGLETIQRALEIYEQFARENFEAYGPDLATSLNNLSVRLSESGDRAGGLEAIQRAVEIIKPFARPGTSYADWYEVMLNNLQERQQACDSLVDKE